MKFKPRRYYRHTTGERLHTIRRIKTWLYGRTLLAENSTGEFVALGESDDNAVNWQRITKSAFYEGLRSE